MLRGLGHTACIGCTFIVSAELDFRRTKPVESCVVVESLLHPPVTAKWVGFGDSARPIRSFVALSGSDFVECGEAHKPRSSANRQARRRASRVEFSQSTQRSKPKSIPLLDPCSSTRYDAASSIEVGQLPGSCRESGFPCSGCVHPDVASQSKALSLERAIGLYDILDHVRNEVVGCPSSVLEKPDSHCSGATLQLATHPT